MKPYQTPVLEQLWITADEAVAAVAYSEPTVEGNDLTV